jgi:hypothetical protein
VPTPTSVFVFIRYESSMAFTPASHFLGFRDLLIRLVLAFALATLYLASALPSHAHPLQFPALNLKCEIPDDWTSAQSKDSLLEAVSPYRTRGLRLNCARASIGITLDDPQYLQFLEAPFTEAKGEVTSSGYVLMNNVRFYFFDGKIANGVSTTYFHNLYFLGNGILYCFSIFKMDENPMNDEELVSILRSCDFIQAPRPHTGLLTFWDVFRPVDGQEHGLLDCIVYAIGASCHILFLFLCPLLFYLGLTYFFFRLLYKRGRKQQPPAADSTPPLSPELR